MKADRVKAVIFDWAGTTVDFGSLAPVLTLQHAFASFGVDISDAEARRDMGLAKRVHISSILSLPRIQQAWESIRGVSPSDADVGEIYQRFIPMQFACLAEYSKVIPGVPETTEKLRRRGLRIGSTTGYTRNMLDVLVESAANEGYAPDCSLSPEDVGCGRPFPFMMYEAAVRLQVYPLDGLVKVGDTVADIQEGLNAGAWSVGVAQTGNMIGLSQQDFEALPIGERESRSAEARSALKAAGAHYAIDTLAELDDVLDDIEELLKSAKS